MKISASALSLNVADVAASEEFARDFLGFRVAMAAEGFVSLSHPDAGFNLIFLQTGLGSFKPSHRAGAAGDGLLIVFVVEGIDQHYDRFKDAGTIVATPIETEPWGERYFQVEDPNGLIYQFVEWMR